jgi:hypothetical protein
MSTSWGAQSRPKDAKTPSAGRGICPKNLNWIAARSSHSSSCCCYYYYYYYCCCCCCCCCYHLPGDQQQPTGCQCDHAELRIALSPCCVTQLNNNCNWPWRCSREKHSLTSTLLEVVLPANCRLPRASAPSRLRLEAARPASSAWGNAGTAYRINHLTQCPIAIPRAHA